MTKRSGVLFDTLAVDPTLGSTLTRQLFEHLRERIIAGRLPVGTRLPSSRALAKQLGVGRNTVLASYDQLLAEGFVEAESGSGTWVSFKKPAASPAGAAKGAGQPRLSQRGELLARDPQPARSPNKINLQPGFPETSSFPTETWSRLLSRNARQRGGDMVGYYDYAGHRRLREAIATYIGAARGVDCEPEQVIVVTGAQAALDLVSRTLLDNGDTAWIEDPGYLGARSALLGSGARLAPLLVDRNGWHLECSGPPPRAIYITPSCQWPLGLSMGVNERMRLLSLAEQHNAWLIEDDYDGEYRFRGQPVPALYGLDRSNRVIYIGTFGKILFSSLRIGFLVVPRELSNAISRAVSITGQFAPLLLQSTLADFIEQGHFATHLKRMRRLYARRQAILLDLCRERLSTWISVTANDAGMQIFASFRPAWDDRAVAAAALAHGVDVQPVSINYRYQQPEHGLLLGFAALDEKAMGVAISGLRAAFEDLERHGQESGSANSYRTGSHLRSQKG